MFKYILTACVLLGTSSAFSTSYYATGTLEGGEECSIVIEYSAKKSNQHMPEKAKATFLDSVREYTFNGSFVKTDMARNNVIIGEDINSVRRLSTYRANRKGKLVQGGFQVYYGSQSLDNLNPKFVRISDFESNAHIDTCVFK